MPYHVRTVLLHTWDKQNETYTWNPHQRTLQESYNKPYTRTNRKTLENEIHKWATRDHDTGNWRDRLGGG